MQDGERRTMRGTVSRYWALALGFLWSVVGVNLLANGPADVQLGPDSQPRTEALMREHLKSQHKQPNDPALWMELGRDYLELATLQSLNYLDHAAEYFDKVLARYPRAAGALMLRGRVQGARALDQKPSSLTRLRWARQGFKLMDEAVSLDPKNAYLRLLRGEASLMAHPILTRGSSLDEDAKRVDEYLRQGAAGLADFAKARLHLFLGNYYQRRSQAVKAREHWQTAIGLAAETQLAKEASQRISGSFRGLGYED